MRREVCRGHALPPGLARWLEAEGHDAAHAGRVGLHRSSDSEIIAYAEKNGRIVVTADHDFPRLLMTVVKARTSVVLFRGGDFNDATAFAYVRRALGAIDITERRHFLMTVDAHRVRRRWIEGSSQVS